MNSLVCSARSSTAGFGPGEDLSKDALPTGEGGTGVTGRIGELWMGDCSVCFGFRAAGLNSCVSPAASRCAGEFSAVFGTPGFRDASGCCAGVPGFPGGAAGRCTCSEGSAADDR